MPLDYDDRTDFENAERGLVDKLDPCIVKDADGQGRLGPGRTTRTWTASARRPCTRACGGRRSCATIQGLFEVTEGIYQVRGFDLSNMTFVEGDSGVIAIDPLISAETAAAALALYRKNRGDRPVTAVIYTHSHADHFGGVQGILPDGAGDVPILAPDGFLEHAVSENVYAGVAMNRRAAYMYGAILERSADRPGEHRPGPGHLRGRARAARPDGGHHPHRAGGDHRRRPDRLPDDPGHRGAGGDELPLPRPPRAVHGGERHPQPAQPADPARRAGPRPADLGALPRRGGRAVRRRQRRRLRLAPLADLGHRRAHPLPARAA